MSENSEFALVPKSPSGLEKVEPGARRIISGIVADMLEQAKKAPSQGPSPFRIVMICSQPGASKSLESLLRHWFENATFLLLQDSGEAAWQELLREDPHLLITADAMPVLRGSEIVRRLLDRQASYPIIVSTPFARDEEWVRESASAGLNIQFLGMPWTIDDVRKVLEAVGLDTVSHTARSPVSAAPERGKTRPLRIVHVDDESWVLEMVSQLIRTKYEGATITTFQNGDKAWEELSRADPDLLITDLLNNNVPGRTHEAAGATYGKSGYQLLSLLAQRKVRFPVLVLSGSLSREGYGSRAREYAGPVLNASFLQKPFTPEQLYAELSKHFGPGEKP